MAGSQGPDGALSGADPTARARAAAVLGRGRWPAGTSERLSELVAHDSVPAVRRAALHTLVTRARPGRALRDWQVAARDADDGVRRAVAAVAPALAARTGAPGVAAVLIDLLDDGDALVAEASGFALGEVVSGALDGPTVSRAVGGLARHAAGHRDALVREACVAALGSLRAVDVDGTDAVLPVLLAAARDKPPIRRRAVIALSAFDDPAAEQAIQEALTDRDWQVRQIAEDLLA